MKRGRTCSTLGQPGPEQRPGSSRSGLNRGLGPQDRGGLDATEEADVEQDGSAGTAVLGLDRSCCWRCRRRCAELSCRAGTWSEVSKQIRPWASLTEPARREGRAGLLVRAGLDVPCVARRLAWAGAPRLGRCGEAGAPGHALARDARVLVDRHQVPASPARLRLSRCPLRCQPGAGRRLLAEGHPDVADDTRCERGGGGRRRLVGLLNMHAAAPAATLPRPLSGLTRPTSLGRPRQQFLIWFACGHCLSGPTRICISGLTPTVPASGLTVGGPSERRDRRLRTQHTCTENSTSCHPRRSASPRTPCAAPPGRLRCQPPARWRRGRSREHLGRRGYLLYEQRLSVVQQPGCAPVTAAAGPANSIARRQGRPNHEVSVAQPALLRAVPSQLWARNMRAVAGRPRHLDQGLAVLAHLLIQHRLQQVEQPEKISAIKAASQPPINASRS